MGFSPSRQVSNTNLNCKRWYIRAPVAWDPYTKVLTIERDSTNSATLSVYSTPLFVDVAFFVFVHPLMTAF